MSTHGWSGFSSGGVQLGGPVVTVTVTESPGTTARKSGVIVTETIGNAHPLRRATRTSSAANHPRRSVEPTRALMARTGRGEGGGDGRGRRTRGAPRRG